MEKVCMCEEEVCQVILMSLVKLNVGRAKGGGLTGDSGRVKIGLT